MEMKQIVFLMPIHKERFDRAKTFLKSFKKHKLDRQADIFFCFSNEEEYAEFNYPNKIVIPEILRNLNRETGIINAKKLFPLKELSSRYKYIITVDSDMLIIKNINLLKACDDFFDQKILWGFGTDVNEKIYKLIINESSKFFQEKEKIDDNGLGLWFNNMCVYKSDTINDFFEKTNIENNWEKLSFWSFDYYIYMFYLLLYQGFTVRNYFPFLGCGGTAPLIDQLYSRKFLFMATRPFLKQVKKLGGGERCFIQLHLDRPVSYITFFDMINKQRLRLLSHITFGKTKRHYKLLYKQYKTQGK